MHGAACGAYGRKKGLKAANFLSFTGAVPIRPSSVASASTSRNHSPIAPLYTNLTWSASNGILLISKTCKNVFGIPSIVLSGLKRDGKPC